MVAVALGAVAGTASAQPISVQREKVLGTYGTVVVTSTLVTPMAPGPGVVFTQPVTHAGASTLRLRFTVQQGADVPYWNVAVTGTDGRRWEHRPASAGETEFWSDEMPGDHATVELVSTVARPAVKLVIDRTAGTTQPTVPRSITEPDEREAWNLQREPILTLGRSVVRLRFVDDAHGSVYVCTGWLVFTSRYMLTNNHCINSEAEARSALADLDFNELAVVPRSVRFHGVVMSDPRLDFSLLELAQPLDRAPLSLGSAAAAHQALVVIEHPAGEPKQVSARGCTVGVDTVPGTTSDPTDFEHACDTLGGSSGSPVLDLATFKVVGLHHLGFTTGDKPVNRAVHIEQVVAAIRARFPDIVRAGGLP
jgi:hypothetical protein